MVEVDEILLFITHFYRSWTRIPHPELGVIPYGVRP